MRKGILAVLAVFLLLASFSAAEMAADKEKPLEAAGKAIGLNAGREQCLCSADTLAKIEQIKKLLAELEASCYSGQQVPVEVPQPSVGGGCLANCLAEQEPYCESVCKKEGLIDTACFDGCYAGIKQKCENSCNIPVQEEKPARPGCVEECHKTNFDKEACLTGCGAPGTEAYGVCYNDCSEKSGEVWDMCQKQCEAKPAEPVPDVLDNCVGTCDEKYSECKESCYAGVGNDPEKMKQAEDCTINQCMPLRDQCVSGCSQQYKKEETFVQKVVNVFKVKLHKSAKWECYDGTAGESWETCKPSEDFQARAREACEGRCSSATNKCGVNSFYVYGEC